MNREAGRGGWLIAMMRVNDSEPLPFIVDTGCPVTCLDRSLESRLGKRLRDATFENWGASYKAGFYRPPEFYLGTTPLRKSGAFVVTLDTKPWSKVAHMPFMGILGMDVLKHYCLQLDFQSGQLRFLDARHVDKKDWGRPFHLTHSGNGTLNIDWHRPFLTYIDDDCVTIDENLTGTKGPISIIDTGDDWNGSLTPKLYQQWTNQVAAPANGEAHSPDGILGGEMYHELDLHETKKTERDVHTRFNTIGLHVLSENLVTLDFPGRTMYLKRTSNFPLADKDTEAAAALADQSAVEVLERVKKEGRLPGWAKNDVFGKAVANFHRANGLDFVTFDVQKEGDSSVYHHTFVCATHSNDWKLKKAWRTDQDGKTIEEFSVPKF